MSYHSHDPYNWPMPQRADLMSLSSIDKNKDLQQTKIHQYRQRMRSSSYNLDTNDIEGNRCFNFVISNNTLAFCLSVFNSCPSQNSKVFSNVFL